MATSDKATLGIPCSGGKREAGTGAVAGIISEKAGRGPKTPGPLPTADTEVTATVKWMDSSKQLNTWSQNHQSRKSPVWISRESGVVLSPGANQTRFRSGCLNF